MNLRLNYLHLTTDAVKGAQQIERYLHGSSIEPKLLHMVKLRASQINGCAYCIDMHWKDAKVAGETDQRLYGLDAWEESSYYNEKERAALAWTEALTTLKDHVPDAVFDHARAHLSEQEIADLTWAVATINMWNRVAISMRAPAGTYQPPKHQPAVNRQPA